MPKTRGARQGRPRETSDRQLELIALELFSTGGYAHTTVEQIAVAAGVSQRTFFRYFESKAAVLWRDFDTEVAAIRDGLAAVAPDVPIMAAIREAVLAANRYRADDVPELRTRMRLIATEPELIASAAVHYDSWERAIGGFVAHRLGAPADSLYPLAVGRATLAVCRAAYDDWSERADADLTAYLDTALRALAAGFADDVLHTQA